MSASTGLRVNLPRFHEALSRTALKPDGIGELRASICRSGLVVEVLGRASLKRQVDAAIGWYPFWELLGLRRTPYHRIRWVPAYQNIPPSDFVVYVTADTQSCASNEPPPETILLTRKAFPAGARVHLPRSVCSNSSHGAVRIRQHSLGFLHTDPPNLRSWRTAQELLKSLF